MNGKASLMILLLIAGTTLSHNAIATADEASDILVEVTKPERDGVEVGMNLYIEGTAELPAGHHLWVFVRRVDFEPFWWPQAEGRVDPVTGKWKARVTFGGSQDVGWRFDLAVAVFKKDAHARLQEYHRDAMITGNSQPIEMPEVAAPPRLFQVIKVSHQP